MGFLSEYSRCLLNHFPSRGKFASRPSSDPSLPQISALGVGFPRYHGSVSHFCVVTRLLPVQKLFSQLLFRGIALSIGINLMCLWEEVSSGSPYAAILD